MDGTPVDVTMWAPGEPASELERSYVVMQTDTFAGSWKTLTDSSANNVICKMAKGETCRCILTCSNARITSNVGRVETDDKLAFRSHM